MILIEPFGFLVILLEIDTKSNNISSISFKNSY